eukprot:TRINITY_DN4435_c0_g1_i4.p1 TRINITY_DN4435_c0_g1~~TRINITY_DN4435_c0_g1_i4.p1  ORF type:complete len:488 (-),score=62.08 TRINITY_DN4435_c0_g1_i4:39-1502(-)
MKLVESVKWQLPYQQIMQKIQIRQQKHLNKFQKGNNMNAIKIENLNVNYNSLNVLKDINLTVKDKEFIAILGPNGGGKTTLLKIILGLIKPSLGKIKIYDEEPNYKKNYIGYVPQFTKFEKNFPVNVFDVVIMGRLQQGKKFFHKYSKNDIFIAEKIMKSLDIYDLKNRQIGQLSGGQMQRVLIARALCMEPKILLLDEPTASVDIKAKNKIYSILKELNKDVTIIIVTHDTDKIYSYTDKVFYLYKTLSDKNLNAENEFNLIDNVNKFSNLHLDMKSQKMEVLQLIETILKYTFLQHAIISSILASIMCGIIGTIIVEKKLVMMSGGIAHTAFGGVGMGYFLKIEPIIGAFIFAVISSFGIVGIKKKSKINTDAVIGMFWSLGMALGIVFISITPGYPPDISSYLFGDILTVTKLDIYMMIALNFIVVFLLIAFFHQIKAYLFCLLYTSDAADDTPCVDLGGRRIIKKKKKNKYIIYINKNNIEEE